MSVWVKICGTTNVDDAETAIACGANALGFIFAPGPRRIAPLDARNIVARLPATLQRIGVFVNEKAERVRDIVSRAGMTGVQLHGDESPEYVQELFRNERSSERSERAARRRETRVFKAIRMDEHAAEKIGKFAAAGDLVDAFLLESPGALRGGSGKTFDWESAATLLRQFEGDPKLRFIVAGGLRPGNVQDALRKLRPWGVDVASGVEKQPGIKDPDAVRDFIDKVREVEATL
ncbi:MAG: phosphoribosylanthranilate isomerase [Candidatus Koribacter versatilis]|uniref:N-(5'-phosphoribosyl)anthranilate isomerase n=1 Tax=Candidatus Korobacter versatilis TaxID=658062 RepID=A0A932A917_9BACT|nr:phosphoribosylanthranilate isomerase [Candidatus Koribacter versatilis]